MTASVVIGAPALFGAHRALLGESPVWDADKGRLLWCDISDRAILAADLKGTVTDRWGFPGKVGSFGLCASGRFIVGVARAVMLFNPADGALSTLCALESEPETNRLNDGKVGPDGAFWIGTMDDRPVREAQGTLYRITADGKAEKKVTGMTVPNGLAWGPGGTILYHSDSRGQWIDAYDFVPATGGWSNRRRIVADIAEQAGRPDGGACDVEGCYWSAGVSAGVLNRYSPDGKLLETLKLPFPAPTMPCFGGDDMKTLFVTSLSDNKTLPPNPNSGGIAVLRLAVAGVPVGKFADR
ncbi:SMP-30/gluconolactonase/LRE family protein [Dongia sedimenti]|uniref:SMP-30/gluconolactonase/LRE family protein n=1 Tax=Dongia sedimenti TaxID=3064282 RepID=A0ABU0YQJ4_9PROT|nr:SMP-30/gluconolactonase/LRE family protein [Rhodospirillaceae bacterium R-7]